MYFTAGLENAPNVSNIIQKVNYRMNVLKNITKYTNTKTSLILYNSLIISIFTYCIQNLMNINFSQLTKLYVLLNKCAHNVLGRTSYRLNTKTILDKLNWLSFHQLLIHESLKLIHRVSYERHPPALNQYLYHRLYRSDISRFVSKPSVSKVSTTAKTANSFLHRTVYIYNTLPEIYRTMPKKKFSVETKQYIKDNYALKNIPKIQNE